MFSFYLPIAMAIAANIFYHLFQKAIDPSVNPLVSLVATYVVALMASLLLFPFFPHEEGLFSSFKQLNWASYALGLAIIGLEIGFLLVYRVGWKVSLANLLVQVAVVIVLLPVGVFFFQERVSASGYIGLLLAIAGLVLIGRG